MTGGVPTGAQRYSILRRGEGETLVIPAVRIRFVMVFLSIWFAIWTAIGITEVVTAQSFKPVALAVIAIAMWSFGWIVAGGMLLWMFSGREIIRIDGGDLEVIRSAFGFSRRRVYRGADIRDLRVEPRLWRGTPRGGAFPFMGNSRFGAIRFVYSGRTQDLALGLAESEARSVLDWLRKRLPQAQ